jgi:hypothetical protein
LKSAEVCWFPSRLLYFSAVPPPRVAEVLALDRFFIRECSQMVTLSHLAYELPGVIRKRPLASAAVSLDRYSVGYSRAPNP